MRVYIRRVILKRSDGATVNGETRVVAAAAPMDSGVSRIPSFCSFYVCSVWEREPVLFLVAASVRPQQRKRKREGESGNTW